MRPWWSVQPGVVCNLVGRATWRGVQLGGVCNLVGCATWWGVQPGGSGVCNLVGCASCLPLRSSLLHSFSTISHSAHALPLLLSGFFSGALFHEFAPHSGPFCHSCFRTALPMPTHFHYPSMNSFQARCFMNFHAPLHAFSLTISCVFTNYFLRFHVPG